MKSNSSGLTNPTYSILAQNLHLYGGTILNGNTLLAVGEANAIYICNIYSNGTVTLSNTLLTGMNSANWQL